MFPELTEIDRILSAALNAKIGPNEDDIQNTLIKPMQELVQVLMLAKEQEVVGGDIKAEIGKISEKCKSVRAQYEQGSAIKISSLYEIREQISNASRELEREIVAKGEEIEEGLATQIEIADVLSIPLEKKNHDWRSRLDSGDYDGASRMLKAMVEADSHIREEVERFLMTKGWTSDMIGLFRKLDGGTTLKDIKSDEWELLDNLRADPLATKVRLEIGAEE